MMLRTAAIVMSAAMCLTGVSLPAKAGNAANEAASVKIQTAESGTDQKTVTTETTAFDQQKISDLYQQKKILLSNPDVVSAAENKTAGGLLISGKDTDITDSRFTFAEELDFSSGVMGRVDLDALAVKGNPVEVQFYLDDSDTPFATITPAQQKRAKKWYKKAQTVSVYDQKITGKHKVSFKIVPTKKTVSDTDTTSIVLRSVTFAKSTVPMIYFNIDESQGSIVAMNGDSEHDTECYGKMTVEIPDGYQCEYANSKGKKDNLKTETYNMEYIRGRGNSTWSTDKKPYKIKLDKKQNLFNMGKNKHWVLLADYYDPSHLRNKTTYWIGKQLGMDYTPEGVYVDVVMNGEYYGSYMLCEQVRLGENRVDLDDLEADDASKAATTEPEITGGYLLSMSPYGDETGKTFRTKHGNEFLIESPSFEDYENEAQYNYIKNYVQNTEDAIYAKDFKKDGKSFEEYMDVNAAIDYYWIQEFSMNGDAFGSTSTYLYKPRNGKLFWGPLWDFDYVAWGNNEYDDYNCEGWQQMQSTWYARLFKNKDFAEKAMARWPQIREQLEAASKDGGQIDQYADEIRDSMKYNSYLYGNNYDSDLNNKDFQQSVDQLKNWIQARIKWVDENLDQMKVSYFQVKFMDGKKQVSTQTVCRGDSAEFPKLAAKKGYTFGGWYVKDEVGESYRVTSDMEIYQNTTLYAKWLKNSKLKPVTKIVLGYDKLTTTYYDFNDVIIKNDDDDVMIGGDGDDDIDISTIQIPYKVFGGNDIPGEVVWKSSNTKLAKVDEEGTVQILGVGKVTITASDKSGKVKASCKLNIVADSDDYIGVDDFKLNRTSVSLKKGGYTILTATPSPEESSEHFDIQYYCADPAVSIEQVGYKCIVTGAKDGTATVMAMGSNDDMGSMFQSCLVKVGNATQKNIRPGYKVTKSGIDYKVTSITAKGGTVKVTGISDTKKSSLKIPAQITIDKKKYQITAVAAKACKGNKKLKSVVIGSNVKTIGESAFENCTKLTKVVFGKQVKSVGKKAFYKCRKLKQVELKSAKTIFKKQSLAKTAAKVQLKAKKADYKTYEKRLKKAGVKKVVKKKSGKKNPKTITVIQY